MSSLRPKTGEATSSDAYNFRPSAVNVDHVNNFSRADRYDVPTELKDHVEGSTFCFTLAEVEQRLSEYDRDGGQLVPGTIYLTSTRDAFLVDGYLRHAAWLLAEVRFGADGEVWVGTGEDKSVLARATKLLAQSKKKGFNVFRSQKVAKPGKPEDWAELRKRNYSENDTRKQLTPIDRAYFARRIVKALRAEGVDEKQAKKQAADEMGLTSVRQLDRYVALLALPPGDQDKLHSGEITMSAMERKSRKQGKGTHKGARRGIPHANMRRAFEHIDAREPPASMLDAYQMLRLHKRIAGIEEPEDMSADDEIDAWGLWLDASKDVIPKPTKPAKPRKKPATNKPTA